MTFVGASMHTTALLVAATMPEEPESPTAEMTNAEISSWLDAHGISYPPRATKAELLAAAETS
jgi:hypothetical protein